MARHVTLDLTMTEALVLKSAIAYAAKSAAIIAAHDRGQLVDDLEAFKDRLEAEIHRESDESAYCHTCHGHGNVGGHSCIDCTTDA